LGDPGAGLFDEAGAEQVRGADAVPAVGEDVLLHEAEWAGWPQRPKADPPAQVQAGSTSATVATATSRPSGPPNSDRTEGSTLLASAAKSRRASVSINNPPTESGGAGLSAAWIVARAGVMDELYGRRVPGASAVYPIFLSGIGV
jgi:hypothetical protein